MKAAWEGAGPSSPRSGQPGSAWALEVSSFAKPPPTLPFPVALWSASLARHGQSTLLQSALEGGTDAGIWTSHGVSINL